MRRLALVFAALLLATPAVAADRYTVPSGGASSGSCGSGSPCTLPYANTIAAAGDVVRMRAGNYGTADINPSFNGAAGTQTIYRPDTLGNPVNVDQILFAAGRSYISVWGVRTTNATQGIDAPTGATRTRDSLHSVTSLSRMTFNNANQCVLYNCAIGDTVINPGSAFPYHETDNWTNGRWNRLVFVMRSNTAATVRPWYPHNWSDMAIDSSQMGPWVMKSGSEQGVMFSASVRVTSMDSHWRIRDYGTMAGIGLGFRDNTVGFFSFLRDTFTQEGPAAVTFFRGSGTSSPANDMTWTLCVVRQGLPIMPANNSTRWTIDRCQVAIFGRSSSNPCMIQPLAGNLTSLTLLHNTFLFYRGDGTDVGGKLFSNEVDLPSAVVTDNVFVRMQSQSTTGCPALSVANTSSSSPAWNRNGYLLINKHSATVDSSRATNIGSTCSGTGVGTTACVTWGNDCSSVWLGPDYTFAITDTTFDPSNGKPIFTPPSKGRIVHTSWPDGYIGAINTAGGGDVTAPGQTTDLVADQASQTSGRVSWHSVGNDGLVGTPLFYDVRRRVGTTFVEGDWAGATQCVGEPAPQVAGTFMSFTDTGLTPSTNYAYAVKTSDGINVSVISAPAESLRTLDPAVRAPGTFYVTKNGSAANTGASLKDDEAKDLAWANSSGADAPIPGDVIIFGKGPAADASFTSDLRPTVSGDSLARITFRGLNPASRDTVHFPMISTDGPSNLGLDWATFRWLKSRNALDMAQNQAGHHIYRDSLDAVRNQGFWWISGGLRSVVSNCDSLGDYIGLTGSTPDFWRMYAESNLHASRFMKFENLNLYLAIASGTQTQDRRFIQFDDATACSLVNVQVLGKVDAGATFSGDVAAHGFFMVGVQRPYVKDCSFTWEQNSTNTDGNEADDWFYAFLQRGGCSYGEYINTVWRGSPSSSVKNVVASFGQTNLIENANRFDGCTWDLDGSAVFGYKDGGAGNGVDSLSLHRCILISRNLHRVGTAPGAGDVPFPMAGPASSITNLLLRHCTFFAPVATTLIQPATGLQWSTAQIKQCAFVNLGDGSCENDALIDFPAAAVGASDTNAVYSMSSPSASRAVTRGGSTACLTLTALFAAGGHDGESVFGPGDFVDTTRATIDLRPRTTGVFDAGPDGYIGALPAVVTVDATPPDPIQDLEAKQSGSNDVLLEWNTVGDDGSVGTATSYDVRKSPAPITKDHEFYAAEQVAGAPTPQIAGNQESFTILGFGAGETWYFAVKAIDEAGNAPEWTTAADGDSVTIPSNTNAITTTLFQVVAGITGADWKLHFSGDVDGDATVTSFIRRVCAGCVNLDSSMVSTNQGGVHRFTGRFSGRVLWLGADSTYLIRVIVTDPDGGSDTLEHTFQTRTMFPEQQVPAKQVFLSPYGNDANDGLTAATPKATLASAEGVAGVNTTVAAEFILLPGVPPKPYYHRDFQTTQSGVDTTRFRVIKPGGLGVVIDGRDTTMMRRTDWDSLTLSGVKVYVRPYTLDDNVRLVKIRQRRAYRATTPTEFLNPPGAQATPTDRYYASGDSLYLKVANITDSNPNADTTIVGLKNGFIVCGNYWKIGDNDTAFTVQNTGAVAGGSSALRVTCSGYGNIFENIVCEDTGGNAAMGVVTMNTGSSATTFKGLVIRDKTIGTWPWGAIKPAGAQRAEEFFGIQLDGRRNAVVSCTIEGIFNGIAWGGSISDTLRASHTEIDRCSFLNIGDDIFEWDNSGGEFITITRCVAVGRNTRNGASWTTAKRGPHYLAFDVFARQQEGAYKMGATGTDSSTAVVYIWHNTAFSSGGRTGAVFAVGQPWSNTYWQNNIFIGTGTGADSTHAIRDPASTNWGVNNYFNWNLYSVAAPGMVQRRGVTYTLDGFRSLLGMEKNGIRTTAAGFVDTSGTTPDLRLTATAEGRNLGRRIPGVNTGSAWLPMSVFSPDLLPDMGAYEFLWTPSAVEGETEQRGNGLGRRQRVRHR